jgi:hypothetical protein
MIAARHSQPRVPATPRSNSYLTIQNACANMSWKIPREVTGPLNWRKRGPKTTNGTWDHLSSGPILRSYVDGLGLCSQGDIPSRAVALRLAIVRAGHSRRRGACHTSHHHRQTTAPYVRAGMPGPPPPSHRPSPHSSSYLTSQNIRANMSWKIPREVTRPLNWRKRGPKTTNGTWDHLSSCSVFRFYVDGFGLCSQGDSPSRAVALRLAIVRTRHSQRRGTRHTSRHHRQTTSPYVRAGMPGPPPPSHRPSPHSSSYLTVQNACANMSWKIPREVTGPLNRRKRGPKTTNGTWDHLSSGPVFRSYVDGLGLRSQGDIPSRAVALRLAIVRAGHSQKRACHTSRHHRQTTSPYVRAGMPGPPPPSHQPSPHSSSYLTGQNKCANITLEDSTRGHRTIESEKKGSKNNQRYMGSSLVRPDLALLCQLPRPELPGRHPFPGCRLAPGHCTDQAFPAKGGSPYISPS